MAIIVTTVITLRGFTDLGRSVTPIFLSMGRFLYRFSTFSEKMKKIYRVELRSLFTVATAQTHFLFNGSFYDQIDGVAMGSPLAPVLANLFMGHHEKLWLENFQCSKILFYRRYVDDSFCLFHSDHDALIFFDCINSRHPNIRFTMEKELNRKLPFLDVLIDNSDTNSFLTRVYRKKTFTGLLTN